MVSLKTPTSPTPMSRADFASVEAYIKHLELQVEYGRMKALIKDMENKDKGANVGRQSAEETIADQGLIPTGGEDGREEGEEGAEEDVGRDEEDVHDEEEGDVESVFLKGNRNAKNPGKLVIGSRQQFLSGRIVKTDQGHRYFYKCARKNENRCKASVVVDEDEFGALNLQNIPKVEDHNHICDEARVIKWKMMDEMEACFLEDITVLPSKIRKKIILKYQVKYRTSPDTWQEVIALMPSDDAIDKRLREVRMRNLGKLPRSRDDLNLETLMENLKDWGGENVKVLDSNQMWEDQAFRAVFRDVEGFSADSSPERVLLFTTDALLSQLAQSAKWSQVQKSFEFSV